MRRYALASRRGPSLLAPQILDLNEVVATMNKILRRVIGEDIDLRTVPGPGLRAVRADPGQLEQVVMNLAVNARDATPTGRKLTIETANILGHLESPPSIVYAIGELTRLVNRPVQNCGATIVCQRRAMSGQFVKGSVRSIPPRTFHELSPRG